MVVPFIIFMGQILLHLWLVDLLHLWLKAISLCLVSHLWSIFITFVAGITFMVFITSMGDAHSVLKIRGKKITPLTTHRKRKS